MTNLDRLSRVRPRNYYEEKRKEKIMRVTIDKDLCTGDQICVDLCPEVFEMDGDIAKVIVDEIPPEFEDVCKEAADSCPAECIKLQS